MRRIIRPTCLLAFGLFFGWVHRLPAPVQELPDTPTPAAKKPATAETSQNQRQRESRTNEQQKSPFARFEGLWTGTITGTAKASFLFTSTASSSATLAIRVSKTGVVTYGTEQPVQGFLSADGQTLSWVLQKNFDEVTFRENASLHLTGRNAARYSGTNTTTGSIANVSGTSTGTLVRKTSG
jgi:hypothetical protein